MLKAVFKDKYLISLFLTVLLAGSLLVTWHMDFDRLGSVPFGNRALAYSLFFKHTVRIDSFWEASGADYAWYGGHYYSGYPPLIGVVTAAFVGVEQVVSYVILKVWGPLNGHLSWLLESWFVALPEILSLSGLSVLVYLTLRRFEFGPKLSFTSGWLLAFTSYALVYATGSNNDLPVAFLVFLSFYLLIRSGGAVSSRSLVMVGLLTGLAATAAYPAVVFLPVWAFFVLFKNKTSRLRSLLTLVVGSLPPLLLLGAYQTYAFGAPWHFAHNYHAYKVSAGQTAANKVDFSLFNIPAGLFGMFFTPLKGLFVYAPLAFLGLVGIKDFIKLRKDVALLSIGAFVVTAVFYASWWDWSGGFDFSSRYLLSTLPFLYIFLAFAIKQFWQKLWWRILFVIVVVWSFITTLVYTFTGIREAIRVDFWYQWAGLGRFESFLKVFTQNNPKDVAPILVRFSNELPGLSHLSFSTVSYMLIGTVVIVAIVPLFLVIKSSKND